MNRFYRKLYIIISALWLGACGATLHPGVKGSKGHVPVSPLSTAEPAAGSPEVNGADLAPTAPQLTVALAAGMSIPKSVKATTLVAKFTANDAAAHFECERDLNGKWFACPGGDSYDFGRLQHQKGYSLKVRARTDDGRLSATPLVISFVADFLLGQNPILLPAAPNSSAPEVVLPATALDLPPLLAGAPTSGTGTNRSLQVGSFFAVNVPFHARVITYASDKTYNGKILTITMLQSPINTLFTNNNACLRSFEQIVTSSDGISYCEATPTPEQLVASTVQLPPLNFVNLSLNVSGGILRENLLVAAFDGDHETIAESNIKLNQCRSDLARGSTVLPMVPKFYGGLTPATIGWCQYQDAAGGWWLGAVFSAKLGANEFGPRVKVYYAVSSLLGVVTETQLLDRLQHQIAPILQPIADVP